MVDPNKQAAIQQAFQVIIDLVDEFPGLLDDEKEVNGADLVDSLNHALHKGNALTKYLEERKD